MLPEQSGMVAARHDVCSPKKLCTYVESPGVWGEEQGHVLDGARALKRVSNYVRKLAPWNGSQGS